MRHVIGHQWAVQWLRQSIVNRQVRHAYCITGPANVGKMTLALAFARAVLCTADDPADRPCARCPACQRSAGGFHPDLRLIAPSAEASAISVELIRDQVVREAALSPVAGQRKVFIIERMHLASPAAANALLKTLEEPPAAVVIILLSERGDALLPTIVSRCQMIRLRPLPPGSIAGYLQTELGLPAAQAELCARLSDGRLGYARHLATDQAAWEQRRQQIDDLIGLLTKGRVERLAFAAQLTGQAERATDALRTWQGWWRDVWLCQQGAAAQTVNLDRAAVIQEQARRIPPAQVRDSLQMTMRIAQLLEGHVNARLAFDVLLLRLPRLDAA